MQNTAKIKILASDEIASLIKFVISKKRLDVSIRKMSSAIG